MAKYPEIVRVFGQKWLSDPKNKSHPVFQMINEEKEFFSVLEKYLAQLKCNHKTVLDHLKNRCQFFDTLYELEIAYFLSEHGFALNLGQVICGIETDIFLEEQKLVVEVKHLNISNKVNGKSVHFSLKSKYHDVLEGVRTDDLNVKRMEDRLSEDKFQDLYPNIVCFCLDVSPANCDYLTSLVSGCSIPKEVCAVAMWRSGKILCLYEIKHEKQLEWKSNQSLRDFFNTK